MLALVTGTGRSGTTLVQEVLSRHPGTGFVSGLDDKLSWLNMHGRWNHLAYSRTPPRHPSTRALSEGRELRDLVRYRIAPSEGYALLDRHLMPGFARPCRDLVAGDLTPFLERRVRDFFGSRERAQHCEVLLQHLTGWPRVGFLRAALPDLKVIHVVRDGRAVTSSWLQMGWWDGWQGPSNWYLGPLPEALQREWEAADRSFAVLAALGWRLLMEAFEQARGNTPTGQWLDVRYEDVVADPRREFGRMLDFLGLPWDASFEAGFARHEIVPGRSHAYRRDLTPPQLHAVEDCLAGALPRWGYQVADMVVDGS